MEQLTVQRNNVLDRLDDLTQVRKNKSGLKTLNLIMKSVFYKPTKHQQIKSKKTDWNTTMNPKPTVICEFTKKRIFITSPMFQSLYLKIKTDTLL